MAEPECQTSRAEQRATAVAKLKRAASLPRMKDGRRPPMHSEGVSESENPIPTATSTPPLNDAEDKTPSEQPSPQYESQTNGQQSADSSATILPEQISGVQESSGEQHLDVRNIEAETEGDGENEERPFSPGPSKRRRPRSRSRSRNSKDFKARNRGAPSPIPHIPGDSSPDEAPPMPIALPIIPPLFTPVASNFTIPQRFMPSPDPSMFFAGPSSPPTPLPLPSLEALQKGLMRSNSARSTADSRRQAMAKLMGETYDPSPSPPPPLPGSSLTRNNTVAGGERIAARELMLGRLGARLAERQQGSDSDREEREPIPAKKRRRRSKRGSVSAAVNGGASDTASTSPPTPLPMANPMISPTHLQLLRSLSTTPNQAFGLRNQPEERLMMSYGPHGHGDVDGEDPDHRHRGVLVEDDDDDDRKPEQDIHPASRPRTPAGALSPHFTPPPFHATEQNPDPPTDYSSDSAPATNGNGNTAPVFDRGSPARFDRFPGSPFTTPLKETQPPLSDEDDEVLYEGDSLRARTPALPDSRPWTPYANNRDAYDREISWVAYPLPAAHKELPVNENDDQDDESEYDDDEGAEAGAEVPVHDDTEQYLDDEPPLSPTSERNAQSGLYDSTSRVSVSSASVVVEDSEVSTNIRDSAPSPSVAIPVSQSGSQQNGDRLMPSGEDWEERLLTRQLSKKASAEGEGSSSQSTWERLKSSISRSASSAGRRSRSNSIINRERNSSISRESGASLTSGGKGERTSFTASSLQQGPSQHPVAPPLMQSPSASASISSLSPPQHIRGGPSPIPPASDADRMKYQNDKLFPFPGMKKLEEQRRDRVRGDGTGDDGAAPIPAQSFSQPQTPDARDPMSPERGYIDLVQLKASTSGGSSKNKLPMSFTDVRQWLSKNKSKKGASLAVPAPTLVAMSPSLDSQFSTESGRPLKTALTDLMQVNGDSDWEGRTPTASRPGASPGQPVPIQDLRNAGRQTPATSSTHTDTERTPKAKKILPLHITSSSDSRYQAYQDTPVDITKPDRYMSPTPDPTSSMSEFPAQTTSESSSSSEYSSLGPTAQAMALLRRLDDTLARGPVPVEESPRKLLFSSPVLQVVNPNTVKDRFLFLFSDILVIAKPIIQDNGTLMESSSIIPTDRRYIVKSVARFRDLRFCPDRAEPQPKSPGPSVVSQSPLLQAFVSQFTTDPDQAIRDLVSSTSIQNDPAIVGQVLFKAHELKRQPLGEYLARRSSKHVLKAFLDNFGFASLRIDVALRVFLHSVHIPQTPGVLEYFLDSFAGRWYEANAKSVAYDRDMAVRLVRAIGQLNELLHGEITAEVGPTGSVNRNIALKDFLDAFRRYDLRRLVSDELIDDVYTSIRHERLSQGRALAPVGSQDIVITFKRPLPTRLTYKIQSDPIIIRLPRADSHVTFHLYGQDLTFDPPVLSFSKSPEASFRVTGTALGPKSIVLLRSGANAIQYQGVPLTYPIPVERAFMRNTFQIAFLNHKKMKRRYMFSVDDHLLRHQWVQSIRQQISKSQASPQLGTENPIPGASEFYQAADDVAFTVLQETLIEGAPLSATPANGSNGHSYGHLPTPDYHHAVQSSPSHRRSKSRSKLYPRQGAGRLEFDLSNNHHYNTSHDSSDANDSEFSKPVVSDVNSQRSWTGREIELRCQQNSLIPAVLSYLQSTGGTH